MAWPADDDHGYYGTSNVENDPHVDANGVLINYLGITNTHDLNEAEGSLSELRIIQLALSPVLGEFD